MKATLRKAQLPCRLGGCGLRSSTRTAPAAYWAAWADVLPTLQKRFPRLATEYVAALREEHRDRECLNEVQAAAEVLRAEGYRPPTYEELAAGARPPNPPPNELDPGEWQHGWQYFAS